jgi:hypothetical protein
MMVSWQAKVTRRFQSLLEGVWADLGVGVGVPVGEGVGIAVSVIAAGGCLLRGGRATGMSGGV